MQLPKVSFKGGVYATIVCIAIAYVVWPLLYDSLGQGALVTRRVVAQSKEVRRECNDVKRFLIIPWRLSFSDTEDSGRLQIGYWFLCSGRVADVRAHYHHRGSDWIADSIVVTLASTPYELVKNEGRAAPGD